MAEKRMFSNKITQSDPFLSMPASAQNLYFHLAMDADDDGFVNRPKAIMRMVNANDDDMSILVARKFIIPFEILDNNQIQSAICVIKHWFIHNTIRSDRKKDTTYIRERDMLILTENGSYTLRKDHEKIDLQPSGNQVAPKCQHSIDKIRLDKNRLDIYGEFENVKLKQSDYSKLIDKYTEEVAHEFIERLSAYIAQTGRRYKNHYATILNWIRKDKPVTKKVAPMPVYNDNVETDIDSKEVNRIRERLKNLGEQ